MFFRPVDARNIFNLTDLRKIQRALRSAFNFVSEFFPVVSLVICTAIQAIQFGD
jgi:hypothetical protein